MGNGEEDTPAKPSKQSSLAQETPAAPSYPDWPSSMQAYYGAGAAAPFFTTTVASPTPHPYMWGTQHALIPPYGTPIPYPALYPPPGVYAHPNMPPAPNMGQTNTEMEGKAPNGKERASNKKFKETPGGKGRQSGKVASGSGNDGTTQSADSGTDGSSDASDDDDKQGYAAPSKKGGFDQMLVDGANAQSNPVGTNLQASVPGNPIFSVPATNLNIGMNLWNANSAGDGAGKMRPNPPGVSPATMAGGEGIMSNQWIQDEREIRREKRKQSNRESARRSRLRKQAECEELQARVEKLTNENQTLRGELQRLSEECQKLVSENNSIKEELSKLNGADSVYDFEINNAKRLLQSHCNNGNS